MSVWPVTMLALVSLTFAEQQPGESAVTANASGTGAISGRVLAGGSDAGVADAIVDLTMQRDGTFRRTATADTDGRFTIDQLPSGIYRLSARPSGGEDVVLLEDPVLVEVIETRPAIAVVLRLPLAAAVSGRVTDERGEPVRDVAIYALRQWPHSDPLMQRVHHAGPPLVLTDAQGRFRLAGLPPVEVILAAEGIAIGDRASAGYAANFATTYHPGVNNQDAAKRISLSQGADIDGVDIRLTRTPGVRVSGVVIDSREQPYAGAKLHLRAVRQTSSGSIPIDAGPDGRFEVRGVLPGKYRFMLGPPLWAPVERAGAPEYARVPLEVRDSDVDGLVIAVKTAVDLRVQVSFEPAPPAPFPEKVGLNAIAPGNPGDITPTVTLNKDATAILKRLAGPLVIRSGWPGDGRTGWSLKGVFLGDRDITDIPTEFTEADSGRVRVVLTDRGAIVTGIVSPEAGSVAPPLFVVLFPENREEWIEYSSGIQNVDVDRSGAFRIRGVRAGRYRIAAVPRQQVNRLHIDRRAFLDELFDRSIALTIIEGELVRMDLKLVSR